MHNRYQQSGGEDAVVRSEMELLESRGVEVRLLEADNAAIRGVTTQIKAAAACFYSPAARRRVELVLRQFRPDVVHAHNLFPMLSAAALCACAQAGVPVVHTLHNYRLLCPNALLFRRGSVCEECLGKRLAWPGVVHGCYRGSRAATLAVASAISAHRELGVYRRKVSRYIALTEFARAKFVQGGLADERITVKPNFLPTDPKPGNGSGGYALFVGRLSHEKGVDVLLRAWKRLAGRVALKVIGSGALADKVSRAAAADPSIEFLGAKTRDDVYRHMRAARALIFPSQCFETFGLTAIESLATGTPVIASCMGSMQEIIQHRRTGLHFTPGDPESLVQQIEWMLAHELEWQQMRCAARAEYESKYTAERNYSMLKEIYQQAISQRAAI